jgi:hypothetical protein
VEEAKVFLVGIDRKAEKNIIKSLKRLLLKQGRKDVKKNNRN